MNRANFVFFALLSASLLIWYIPNKAWVLGTRSIFDSVPVYESELPTLGNFFVFFLLAFFLKKRLVVREAWGFQKKVFVDPFALSREPCIMYGLGIARDLTFEVAMKQQGCQVYAFDCTSPPYMIQRAQDAGITLYPWCIGEQHAFTADNGYIKESDAQALTQFKSLPQVMQTLQHSYVSLLKMDIEGFEWGVFESLLANKATIWPQQLAFELHLEGTNPKAVNPDLVRGKNTAAMHDLFRQLRNVGYRVLYKQLNPGDPFCCEFTLTK